MLFSFFPLLSPLKKPSHLSIGNSAFYLRHVVAFCVIAILYGCYLLKNFFLPNPNRPTKPVPKRSLVAGSGMGRAIVDPAVLFEAEGFTVASTKV
jgi:hypothetical protein